MNQMEAAEVHRIAIRLPHPVVGRAKTWSETEPYLIPPVSLIVAALEASTTLRFIVEKLAPSCRLRLIPTQIGSSCQLRSKHTSCESHHLSRQNLKSSIPVV